MEGQLFFFYLINCDFVRSTLLDARNIQFFGFDAQQKVTTSYVLVIGLGGVGSHAASMLLRSGVGRLLLVDFDQVFYIKFVDFLSAWTILLFSCLNH